MDLFVSKTITGKRIGDVARNTSKVEFSIDNHTEKFFSLFESIQWRKARQTKSLNEEKAADNFAGVRTRSC